MAVTKSIPRIDINCQLKRFFFDRAEVKSAMDKKTHQALRWAGGFISKAARRSMRPGGKGGKVSKPGEPPRWHTKMLRDRLWFFYSPAQKTVVVGPAKINQANAMGVGRTIPQVLEFGGQVRMVEAFSGGKWWRADLRSRRRLAGNPMRVRTATYAARPYMKPAMDKAIESGKIPRRYSVSVRGN